MGRGVRDFSGNSFNKVGFLFSDIKIFDDFTRESVPKKGFLAIFESGKSLAPRNEFFSLDCHFLSLAYNRGVVGWKRKIKDKKYENKDKEICRLGHLLLWRKARSLNIKNSELCQKFGLSRSTLARHYHSITEIKIKEERRVVREFRKQIAMDDDIWTVTRKLLMVVSKNKEVIRVCAKRGEVVLLKKLALMVNEVAMQKWTRYEERVNQIVQKLGVYTVVAVVEEWAEEGFLEEMREEKVRLIAKIYKLIEKNAVKLAEILQKSG